MQFFDASFFALLALVIFFWILARMKVPGLLTKGLDDRSARIARELEEAQKLREEAEALIADYRRKAKEAATEAQSIVEQAKAEADAFAKESRRKMSEMLERRTASAEAKIAQAEALALKEVRAAATDLAVAAAAKLLAAESASAAGVKLVDNSIAGISDRLN
jgi:F-type H+-transporting ATPase subunit b